MIKILRCFVLFTILVKFVVCQTPNLNESTSLDDLFGQVFNPANTLNVGQTTTQRPTVGPVIPLNVDTGKTLDSLIDDIFKPVDDFGLIPATSDRPQPTVGPVQTPPPAPSECPSGRCVPRYLCIGNLISRDGNGLLQLSFAEKNRGSPLPQDQYCSNGNVCCSMANLTATPVQIPTATPVQIPTETPVQIPTETPVQIPTAIPVEIPQTREFKCGTRYVNPMQVASGNQLQSQYGEFPWTVAILRDDPYNQVSRFIAGGSIIHPNVILTAAHYVHHCIGIEYKITVRAGEWDTNSRNELLPHQDRRVKKIIVHDRFNEHNLHNDVALLILESPLEFNEAVQPICLPPQNQLFDGVRCVSSGWGKNEFGKRGRYSVIMKKIELSVWSHQQCESTLRTTRLGWHFVLDNSFICAGGEPGTDTCTGDGGSPLACADYHDRYYQAGIVAWGLGCGSEVPGAYTNVALFRLWIDQQMAVNYFETSFYE